MGIRYLDEEPDSNTTPIVSSTPRKIRYLDEEPSTKLEGSVSYDKNIGDSVVKGISNIPAAIGQGIGDIAGKAVQTGTNLVTKPAETIEAIIPATIHGAASGVEDLANGLYNLPGTLQNVINPDAHVKATTTEDWNKIIAPEGSAQRAVMNKFEGYAKQAPLADVTGSILPYALASAESLPAKGLTGFAKILADSNALRFAGMGALGTPSTNLSDRITSAGTNAAASPEALKVAGKLGDASLEAVKKPIRPLDELLRERVAGISPEVYNTVKNVYFKDNIPAINDIIGNNPLEIISGSKKAIDTMGRREADTANYAQSIKDIANENYNIDAIKNKISEQKEASKNMEPQYNKQAEDVSNYIINDFKNNYDKASAKSDLLNQAIQITDDIRKNVEQHEKDLGKNVGVARSELDTQKTIPVNDIQQGINAIVKSYSHGTDINPAKIGASKTLQQIQEILDKKAKSGIVQGGKLGFTTDIYNPQAGISPVELNQIKKLIQDNTTWDAATSKEGNTLKTELYNYINKRIQDVDSGYATANEAYNTTKDALDSLSEVTKESLASKLSNPDSITGKRVLDKLSALDNILPADRKISPMLNQLKEVQGKLQEAKDINDNQLMKGNNLSNLVVELGKNRINATKLLKEGHPNIPESTRMQLYQLYSKNPSIIQTLDKTISDIGNDVFVNNSNNTILESNLDSAKAVQGNALLKGDNLINVLKELDKNFISIKTFLDKGHPNIPEQYRSELKQLVDRNPSVLSELNSIQHSMFNRRAASEFLGKQNSDLGGYTPYAVGGLFGSSLTGAATPVAGGLAAGKFLYSPAGQRTQLAIRKGLRSVKSKLNNPKIKNLYQQAIASEMAKRNQQGE